MYFSVRIPHIYVPLFCKHFVRQSFGQATKGLIFFVKIRLIDAHLFYEYFGRQSVRQAIKDINVFIYNVNFSSTIYDTVLILFCEELSDEWASILQKFCPYVCCLGYKRHDFLFSFILSIYHICFASYGCCHPCYNITMVGDDSYFWGQ